MGWKPPFNAQVDPSKVNADSAFNPPDPVAVTILLLASFDKVTLAAPCAPVGPVGPVDPVDPVAP